MSGVAKSSEETLQRFSANFFSNSENIARSSAFTVVSPSKTFQGPVFVDDFLSTSQNSPYGGGDNNVITSPIAALEDFASNYFCEESSEEAARKVNLSVDQRSLTHESGCFKVKNAYKRENFSVLQSEILEDNFKFKQDLSPSSGKWLAQLLGLPKRRVVTWFQNRRAKERKRAGIKLPRHGMKCSQLHLAEGEVSSKGP